MLDDELEKQLDTVDSLEAWVSATLSEWDQNYTANYKDKFKEYRRIFQGIYSTKDKTRESERSQLMSPATTQAVESSVAEIEEATFGRGAFFDIKDDIQFVTMPEQPQEGATDEEIAVFQQQAMEAQAIFQDQVQAKLKIEFLRNKLHEDFSRAHVRKSIGEVLLNAAIFGTGIAEVVLDQQKESKMSSRPTSNGYGNEQMNGVVEENVTTIRLKPVLPQNFRIDPSATSIKDALGVAIIENVSPHQIQLLQEQGVYEKVEIGAESSPDTELSHNENLTRQPTGTVKLTKYFGWVPKKLLDKAQDVATFDELSQLMEEGSEEQQEPIEDDLIEDVSEDENKWVEACVVLANDTTILKSIENPYKPQTRPIVAFQWDIDPGEFWGRGVVEKAFGIQKALNTELRARVDNLALQNSPALAMDATRMPRGEAKKTISPGQSFLTNGDPRTVLHPFTFTAVNANTFQQTQNLQEQIQQATGAIDSAGFPGSINQETAAGISMGLGAIIKRQKRTLVNFQESFLVPFVKMAACWYQQFASEKYPVEEYTFIPTTSLGIIAREYETSQLVQLLQTMPSESPVTMLLIKSVIENMQLKNREELNDAIDQSMQPDPQTQQLSQLQAEINLEFQKGQTAALFGQASESEARAKKIETETKAIPVELENDRMNSIAKLQSAEGELTRDDKMAIEEAKSAVSEKKVGIEEAKLVIPPNNAVRP